MRRLVGVLLCLVLVAVSCGNSSSDGSLGEGEARPEAAQEIIDGSVLHAPTRSLEESPPDLEGMMTELSGLFFVPSLKFPDDLSNVDFRAESNLAPAGLQAPIDVAVNGRTTMSSEDLGSFYGTYFESQGWEYSETKHEETENTDGWVEVTADLAASEAKPAFTVRVSISKLPLSENEDENFLQVFMRSHDLDESTRANLEPEEWEEAANRYPVLPEGGTIVQRSIMNDGGAFESMLVDYGAGIDTKQLLNEIKQGVESNGYEIVVEEPGEWIDVDIDGVLVSYSADTESAIRVTTDLKQVS